MTVCIAAIAHRPLSDGPYIVTASDTMVSGSILSMDASSVKSEPFHRDWTAMMAAEDLTQCIPIIEKAKEYFKGRKNSLQVARAVFKKAFQRHLVEMREDAVLGSYGLNMEEFLKSGKRKFTEKQFDSLCERMEKIEARCEFLVYGFDDDKRPHIFQVADTGSDGILDKPGFSAIGSGCYAAQTILYSLEQSVDKTLAETVFNVCAAKFMAERSHGVGRDTYLFVKKFGSTSFSHSRAMLDEIRSDWEEGGCPRVPDGAIKRLENIAMNCT